MKDDECIAFLQWALPKLQMRWRGFRKVRKQVCKRIARRLSELGMNDCTSYRRYLESNPSEWEVLDSFCRITISRFYRDRSVFDYLGDEILPALAGEAARAGDKRVRCWSAGCASGEEVYTLKAVWRHADLPSDVALYVLGTDVDPAVLQRARRGCYTAGSLKELREDWLESDFQRIDDEYCVRNFLREGVEFEQQDIREEQPEGPFDLILCRHLVFTYFAEDLQRTLLDRMLERLTAHGVLVTGKQEPLPPGVSSLTECGPHTGVYRKKH